MIINLLECRINAATACELSVILCPLAETLRAHPIASGPRYTTGSRRCDVQQLAAPLNERNHNLDTQQTRCGVNTRGVGIAEQGKAYTATLT